MKKTCLMILGWLTCSLLVAQISLDNASFEGDPQDATIPTGWHACEKGSTPDILPGAWGVYNESYEGETFMGLITRQNGTYESVGQRLSAPMEAKECYDFSLYLAHSKTYANYNKPVKLRIWGGESACNKEMLLVETDFINHEDWKKYEFRLYSKTPINYLILEAYYMDGIYFHYNGNILIDNCSTINTCKRAMITPPTAPNSFTKS